jgi:hypothetical protein
VSAPARLQSAAHTGQQPKKSDSRLIDEKMLFELREFPQIQPIQENTYRYFSAEVISFHGR